MKRQIDLLLITVLIIAFGFTLNLNASEMNPYMKKLQNAYKQLKGTDPFSGMNPSGCDIVLAELSDLDSGFLVKFEPTSPAIPAYDEKLTPLENEQIKEEYRFKYEFRRAPYAFDFIYFLKSCNLARSPESFRWATTDQNKPLHFVVRTRGDRFDELEEIVKFGEAGGIFDTFVEVNSAEGNEYNFYFIKTTNPDQFLNALYRAKDWNNDNSPLETGFLPGSYRLKSDENEAVFWIPQGFLPEVSFVFKTKDGKQEEIFSEKRVSLNSPYYFIFDAVVGRVWFNYAEKRDEMFGINVLGFLEDEEDILLKLKKDLKTRLYSSDRRKQYSGEIPDFDAIIKRLSGKDGELVVKFKIWQDNELLRGLVVSEDYLMEVKFKGF